MPHCYSLKVINNYFSLARAMVNTISMTNTPLWTTMVVITITITPLVTITANYCKIGYTTCIPKAPHHQLKH